MASVRDVADYLLLCAEEEGMNVTHLKLQKLCYYAQGYSLALFGEPMFTEPIEAWEHGPVIRMLYNEYKEVGKAPIPAPSSQPKLDHSRITVLDEVYRRFGWMTAWDLRNRTHDERPWKEAWRDPNMNAALQHDSMRDFFRDELINSRRPPQPMERSDVLDLLHKDDDMRERVGQARQELDAGRGERWE